MGIDNLGGPVDAGTRPESDCLSSPQRRVLLGSARGADIYLPFAERLLWFCSALSSLPGQVPTTTSTPPPMGTYWPGPYFSNDLLRRIHS
jgi:hypothetical protein